MVFMISLKKIIFPLFSIFLLWQTIEIIRQLNNSQPSDITGGSVLFVAFLINLYITGFFAFPGFVYPSNKFLPRGYYQIKNPKWLKKTYLILGVKYFRFFLVIFFWGKKNNQKKYFDGRKGGLQNLIYQSKQSEFGHFASFVFILAVSVFMIFKSFFLLALFTSMINLIFNLYPVILQRMHRMRIDRIKNRYPAQF